LEKIENLLHEGGIYLAPKSRVKKHFHPRLTFLWNYSLN